ncbi:YifB family Mg chelatase-like AAA ATPase [Bacillus sp. REN16]|uniref:YifB family Mg chelatase-like AAA ATPase n=1 Tax=Bacillus sp. REN16 TaxID=2887296 RepID=UPI001E64BD42|nr:YifB family Mg chelatase-like AAA ATPase [Bacillus sp. REN16]MCC3356125.1 YifB family Mg chelatase-like AAA ATPase [Bacillus sp. REN16]
MTTVVTSIGLRGLEGYKVNVEVQIIPGRESVSLVGLPDASVKESKDRVMATLYANNCSFPGKKIIINLSPSEQKKNIPIFDLAMAIGLMKEMHYIQREIPENTAFLGALSLTGEIKSVKGMLPAILAAKRQNIKILYLPFIEDLPFANLEGIDLRFVHSLDDVVQSLSGKAKSMFQASTKNLQKSPPQNTQDEKDFKYIIGHQRAKRALEIAAAGAHNVLLIGPPGSGKSLLSESLPSILPPLTKDSQFDVMSIYQLAEVSQLNPTQAPFRSPHHSSSSVSLIGGSSNPKPGEVSLAHHGVLFLDEMAEFPRRSLDMLRQPIETGKVTISRAATTVIYPSRFILIGAMNPCPCGYLGDRSHYCTCTPKQINAYQNRISGPILDRIDIILELESVPLQRDLQEKNESSQVIRRRVIEARNRQHKRYQGEFLNSIAENEMFRIGKSLQYEQKQLIQKWSASCQWSSRVQMKILRLARTISDLSGDESITNEALWEAMSLRRTKAVSSKVLGAR